MIVPTPETASEAAPGTGPYTWPYPAADAAARASGAPGLTHEETGKRFIEIGVAEPIDPAHAPVPRTLAERLFFAQLYQPLVRRSCTGRVEPLLAARWRTERDGRAWTFTLRDDARAWNGEPITAADVVASWRVHEETGWIAKVVALDARTVRVETPEPVDVGFFARPEFAVRASATEDGWPVGSGPYRPVAIGAAGPDEAAPDGQVGIVSLSPRTGGPRLRFHTIGDDARNALDAGADLIVTGDPDVVGYAADAADFRTIPLAWDRTYLLVTRATHARPDTASGRPFRLVRPPEAVLAALARDAVRSDARPAPAELADPATCARNTPMAAARGGIGRRSARGQARPSAPALHGRHIVYLAGDAAGRALAERLVALALDPRRPDAAWLVDALPGASLSRASPSGAPLTAEPLAARAFAEALGRGDEFAFIVPVDHSAGAAACDVLVDLFGHAPWTASGEGGGENGGATIVPLIETRKTLIVRRGVGGVAVDGNGTLLLDAIRRASAPVGGAPTDRAADHRFLLMPHVPASAPASAHPHLQP